MAYCPECSKYLEPDQECDCCNENDDPFSSKYVKPDYVNPVEEYDQEYEYWKKCEDPLFVAKEQLKFLRKINGYLCFFFTLTIISIVITILYYLISSKN